MKFKDFVEILKKLDFEYYGFDKSEIGNLFVRKSYDFELCIWVDNSGIRCEERRLKKGLLDSLSSVRLTFRELQLFSELILYFKEGGSWSGVEGTHQKQLDSMYDFLGGE